MSLNEYSRSRGTDVLEARLAQVGRQMPYPPTPDLARNVRARLVSARPSGPLPAVKKWQTRWAVAAFAVLLLVLSYFFIPQVQAIVHWIARMGAVEIRVGTPTPTPPDATPQSTPIALWSLDLAGETTLEQARASLPFALKVPTYTAGLGQPDRVFVQRLGGPSAILAWTTESNRDNAEMFLFALTSRDMAYKYLESSEMVQNTVVGSSWGLWIRGPHVVEVATGPAGSVYGDLAYRRLVGGHTLLWVVDGLTYRLETKLPLEEAVKVAESLK